MKYLMKILAVMCCAALLTGCGSTDTDDVKNDNLTSSNVTTEHMKLFEEKIVGKVWFEAGHDGTQPAGDSPTLGFGSDGTGEIWLKVGDGGVNVMYFEYELQDDGNVILKEDANMPEEPSRVKLEDKWKEIRLSLSEWDDTDVDILTVTFNNSSTAKYYSEQAEILEDGSIKLSDGTIVS